ncbi:hypothetical protein [Sphingomonas sp. CV7422]|uniref:hypothetical protein n=1 Tax=Sphingomonas sp. CV7422 TaxID=3018036 RepID=UPI0022FE5F61|nr:hypothetical protein [Sphingomonas sp. CV7422]
MHTVIETPAYLAVAKEAGMGDVERQAVVDLIAINPEAGEAISCRDAGARGSYASRDRVAANPAAIA